MLPVTQFEIVINDNDWIVLRDKVVDKLYSYSKLNKSWKFPTGSRQEIINKLVGFNLFEE